jgi:PD-(D/E)XK endonuclease
VLTTDQKGSIAEAAIAFAAIELGIGVFKPLSDGERYDLIFDMHPRLVRDQCKTATLRGDVLSVPCYSSRRSADGFLKNAYGPEEVDAFAAYSRERRQCYFLPIIEFAGRTTIQLRLSMPRNNQRRKINWARDFEFGATLPVLGAVAQLGERRAGSA